LSSTIPPEECIGTCGELGCIITKPCGFSFCWGQGCIPGVCDRTSNVWKSKSIERKGELLAATHHSSREIKALL